MNNKRLKLLIVPLVITIIFFALQAFFLVNRFGFFSIVEEIPLDFKKTEQQGAHLLNGQKISASFKASEDNLGIVMIKLAKFGQGKDDVVFRIKKEGKDEWYHESKFFGSQVNDNEYFTLGFPLIVNSKNNTYVFELESLAGSNDNGIGIIKNDPIAAAMYKYSVMDLMNSKTLFSFTFKKFIYVIKHINYWQITAVFAVSYLLALFIKKKKITVKKISGFLLNFKKNYRKILKAVFNKIKSKHRLQNKKIKHSFNQLTHWFTSTKFYLQFLNTTTKKKVTIGVLIFLLALTYRFSSFLVNQDKLFYTTLGGGGDYDQFIRAATCALDLCSRIIHQNLLIESLVLGMFYKIFGFIGGLKAYLYLMLILSSIVATLPYFLLSRKNWISIGGIIGSLFLATSDFLTQISLNYPPDNGSVFIFSAFFIVYLLSMHFGTIRWLIAFGLMGLFDGMFKAMFLINDLAALALFVPVFFYEKTKSARGGSASGGKKWQSLFSKKDIKILLLSLLPLLLFIVIYSVWEYFVQIKFTAPYFLRMLIETGGSNFKFETMFFNRSSGKAEHGLILQLFYLLISGLVMVKRMISFSDLQIIFLAPIFIGLLFFIRHSSVKIGKILLLSFVNIALLVSIKNNYLDIHQTFPGEYIYANWTLETYANIFLFTSIIFLFLLNFKYQAFKLALPIVPYYAMLVILTKNAPWERLLAHVIVWSIILFSFLIDWILDNSKKNYALKRLWIGPILLVLFIFFYTIPKTSNMIANLYSGINSSRNEVKYLKWVNSELPENAIVLAGGKSDLITVAENINRPMVYNSLWSTSLLIRPNRIPGILSKNFNLIDELKNEDNFNKKIYFVLESDIDLWRKRLQSAGDGVFTTDSKSNIALHAQDFSITLYKTNQKFNKNIYELISNVKIEP